MSAVTPEIQALIERSRTLGGDPTLAVHGGGNTSSKVREANHLGQDRPVLRIKGSGTDLATIDASGFPGLFLEDLLTLHERSSMSDQEMVDFLAHCMVAPGSRAPSIETLLHAFLPARHVDHSHADGVCALTNHPEGRAAVAAALGDQVAFIPYVRPGFALSRQVAGAADARAVVLEHHGLVTWSDNASRTLALHQEIAAAAERFLAKHGTGRRDVKAAIKSDNSRGEVLSAIRSAFADAGHRVVLLEDERQRVFADRPDADLIARFRGTPDHMLRIGPWSAVVPDAAHAGAALEDYQRRYQQYVERHRSRIPPGIEALAPLPRVVLVPGLGAVAVAVDHATARVIADLSLHSHRVSALALDAFGTVDWLTEEEVFDFEYWPLELRKLAGAGAPPPLSGTIVGVTGSAPWGGATIQTLADSGAVVVTNTQPENGDGERILSLPGASASDVAAAARSRFGGLDLQLRLEEAAETSIDLTLNDHGVMKIRGGGEGPTITDTIARVTTDAVIAHRNGVSVSTNITLANS